jgi:hypothetical protein
MIEISFIHILISIISILAPAIIGVLKYVDHKTVIAENRMKNEITETRTALKGEITEMRAIQNASTAELRKISENLLEIRTLLFGALNQPGILNNIDNK